MEKSAKEGRQHKTKSRFLALSSALPSLHAHIILTCDIYEIKGGAIKIIIFVCVEEGEILGMRLCSF